MGKQMRKKRQAKEEEPEAYDFAKDFEVAPLSAEDAELEAAVAAAEEEEEEEEEGEDVDVRERDETTGKLKDVYDVEGTQIANQTQQSTAPCRSAALLIVILVHVCVSASCRDYASAIARAEALGLRWFGLRVARQVGRVQLDRGGVARAIQCHCETQTRREWGTCRRLGACCRMSLKARCRSSGEDIAPFER